MSTDQEQQQQNDMNFEIKLEGDSNDQNTYNNDFAGNQGQSGNNQNQNSNSNEQYVYNNDGNNVLGDLNDNTANEQNININLSSQQSNQPSQQMQQQTNQNQNIENPDKGGFKFSTCVATVIFKIFALFSYLILPLTSDDPLLSYVMIILFTTFDFWVIKNISGRLLVGLKWYSECKEDGTEVWLFESQAGNYVPNGKNAKIFWGSQIVMIIFWSLLFVIRLITLSFTWAMFIVFPCSMHLINFYGYYKCRGEHQKKGKQFTKYVAKKGIDKALK